MQAIYTLLKRSPLKWKYLRLSSARVKIFSNSFCQSWNDKSIPLQILYPSSVSWKITLLYFFSSNNIYFAQKEPIKMKFFKTFKSSGQNLSNSSCQLWNDKSVPLQILRNSSFSWHNSSAEFKLILFQVWIKGSHQNPNFECSGKNLSYSSCHFPNYKSVESDVR